MEIIGRNKEQDILSKLSESNKPEFLVVYGRRRVGKTFLIKQYFNNKFSFYATGLLNEKTKGQLAAFNNSLVKYGLKNKKKLENWMDAFSMLTDLIESGNIIRDSKTNKIVIFIDEAPWLDTARSDFKSALDYFWNSYASSNPDILLIVCGSATSWIVNNILTDKGGFYNRVTKKMLISPFTIDECNEYYKKNNIVFSNRQVIESYMIFGGIPYYLNLLDKRLSLAQNVDELIFNENGELHFEINHLFSSLFKHSSIHSSIIDELAKRKKGISRKELVDNMKISSGSGLTTALKELEECGFIRKYNDYKFQKNNPIYQMIDPFTLFAYEFLLNGKVYSWMEYLNTPGYYSWRGYSFEILCLNHISKIKEVLGISGVISKEYSFFESYKNKGAQIDLIIDRNDDVINICEIKCSNTEYEVDKDYETDLLNKIDVFRNVTKTKKALRLTMITNEGLVHNKYSDIIMNEINFSEIIK